jgi:adenosylmethionine-8-amino-7-oxononanoate aminotransferase
LIFEEDHCMKRTRYTEERIAFALRQAESGTPVAEVIRKMGVISTIVVVR